MRCPDCGNLELPDVPRCGKCGRSLLPDSGQAADAAPLIEGLEAGRAEEPDAPQPGIEPRSRKTARANESPAPARDRPPAGVTSSWPKCQWHPDRATKDKCGQCGKPVCAMCGRTRFGRLFCKDCFAGSSSAFPGLHSGKFSGLSASFFETVKEVLFTPGSFFRNLPTGGSAFRPFLFGMINWFIGSMAFLMVFWAVVVRTPGTSVDNVHEVLLLPALYGAVFFSMALSTLGFLPFHLSARLLGGRGSAFKSFRMFNLCSAACLLVMVPPVVGTPFALVFTASSLYKAVSEVHEMDLVAAFAAFLVPSLALLAGAAAFSLFFLFHRPFALLS